MKNNFLSKAYGGVMEARHKLNGLGLPRQWKVITSTLLLLFTFAIGNVWGDNVTLSAADMVAGSTKSHITPDAGADAAINSGQQVWLDGSTKKKYDVLPLSSSCSAGEALSAIKAKSVFFTIDEGYKISGLSICGASNKDASNSAPIVLACWTGTIGTKPALITKITLPHRQTSSLPSVVAASIPDGTKVIALYRRVKVNNTTTPTELVASGGSDYGSGNTGNLVSVTISYEALAPATKHTVTIDPNGGSYASTPDGWTESAGVYTKSIEEGTSFTAPEGLTNGTDDLSWKDGSDNDVTFPVSITGDITFVAQWAPHTASSDATLSALSVAGCTLNETFDPATTAYTITLPFYGAMPVVGDVTATKNDSNAEDPEVSISSNVITIHCEAEDGTTTKDYTITVTIAPAPASSSSINIEQLVLDNGKSYDIVSALTAANIVTDGRNGLDSLNDVGKTNRNYAYLGLKLKKANADIIKIVVPAEKALNVKFGNVGVALTTTINGVAGSNVAKKTDGYSSTFHLDAAAVVREVVFHSSENQTVTLQQVKIDADVDPITLPWLVTYDAGEHGTCATAKQTWTGTALTLPAVTPESGWNFEGWNDDEDNPVSSPYTPTKNVTLTAQYTAQASPYDLTSLTYKIGTGAATNVGYTDGTYTYNIVLPYKASYDAITVTPVLKEATSYLKGDEVLTVSSLPGAATFTVVEAGGASEQLYTINFSKAAKDGTSIFKAELTSPTAATYSGLYVDDENSQIALSNDGGKYKFAGTSNFIKMALTGGTFATNDKLTMTYSANPQQGELAIYDNTDKVAGTAFENNTLDFPAGANGLSTLYIRRTDANNFNGWVLVAEVTRVINPVLKAITFAGVDATVNEGAKTVTVTVPNATDLGTMAVVPTIYRNAPHATTPEAVISNAGDWIEGDNTYRVMDKDGDYTDYTITLTRDVLKHTVSFNTHGGSTIDPVQVVDGGYLAPAQVPEDPTKDENVFKFWSETEDGAEVDITTVQINADKTFHAVWEAEPAGIKLFDGEGNLNTTNFISPAKETITIDEVEYPTLVAFGSNRSSLSGAKQADVVLYNATTNETKIKFQLYNTNSSAKKAYLWMVEEGATESGDPIEIEVAGETRITTGYYTFNSNKNRSFYLTSGAKSDIKVLQAKVIESGEAIQQFGQAGYVVNFNKGRMAVAANSTVQFEGASIHSNEDYGVLNSSNFKPKTYIQFNNAVANTVVKITKSSSNKYYVTNDLDNKGEGYSTDTEVELTTTGTWYIGSLSSGSVAALSKIEFIAPKCEQPTVVDMENIGLCEGDAFTALTVSANVTDGGTLHYQWYKHPAAGDDEAVGTDAASYTPEADGQYYVVVTNRLADHSDNSATSNTITVEHFASAEITTAPAIQRKEAGQLATLTVVATGKAPLTYQWYTCDDEAGSNPVIIEGADEATYEVTVTVGMSQYYKVVVGSGCGSAEAVTLVEEWHEVAPANVTGSRTWDWAAENMGTIETVSGSTEYLMANVSSQVPNTEAFRSDMLYITANYANRSASNKFFQGWQIRFYTEVPGKVSLNCRAIHGTMSITINGTVIDDAKGSDMGTATTPFFVPAGWVTIVFDNQSSGYEGEAARVQKIIFNATPDYTRTEMLGAGVYGTICVDHNVPEGGVRGVTVYEIAGREPQYGKIAFDEVTEMEAGVPYVFIAHGNEMALYYGETKVDEPVDKDNGMYGTFVVQTLTELDGIYYFAQKALWSCVDLTSLNLPANRAYVKLSEIDYLGSSSPAPGRKRLLIGVNGAPAVATGFENGEANEAPRKVLINGELFILRGEKMYDAKGQLVK